MNENNRRQAEVPKTCRVLYNAAGTAPGMWFEKGDKTYMPEARNRIIPSSLKAYAATVSSADLGAVRII